MLITEPKFHPGKNKLEDVKLADAGHHARLHLFHKLYSDGVLSLGDSPHKLLVRNDHVNFGIVLLVDCFKRIVKVLLS